MAAPPGNWRLAWADEFNGTHLDPHKWTTGLPWTGDDGTNRHFDSHFASYISDSDVIVSDGTLKLLTQRQDLTSPSGQVYHYTEGMITTANTFEMTYGYVEMRAQIPAGSGKGLWPAFWMLGNNGWPPEDDVAEFFTSSNRFHQGLAYGGSRDDVHWDDMNSFAPLPAGFHTYGMEWGPGYQVFSVDGQITHATKGASVPSQPMYFLLNSGVESMQPPDSTTVFPNAFEVDYMRVYKPMGANVSNPGFEGGGLGAWNGSGNASVVSTNPRSGTHALQLAGAGSMATQTITGLKPGTSYVLSAYSMVSDPATTASIGIDGSAAGPGVNSTGYAMTTMPFTTGPASTSVTIEALQSAGSGNAWFDDFAVHPAGQIENGDLEWGAAGGAWDVTGAATVVADHPHGGHFALREDGPGALAQQTIYGLSPNTAYRLTGYARKSGSGEVATLGVSDFGGGPELDAPVTASRYRQLSLTFTTGPGSTAVTIFCAKPIGSGSAWFDDLKLSPVKSKPGGRGSRRAEAHSNDAARREPRPPPGSAIERNIERSAASKIEWTNENHSGRLRCHVVA